MTASDTESPYRNKPGKRPLVVGLTGGIGSGKSTVAKGFADLGVPVIDADRIAHDLVEPGQPALAEVIRTFGVGCLAADGRLDRAHLRRQVFTDVQQRHRLEAILHPLIRSNIIRLVNETESAYCVVVIPLLLETGQTDLVDRILVVDAPVTMQIARVSARDGLSSAEITAIMATQADRSTRLAAATDVICNDADRAALADRIEELHAQYMEISLTD